MNHETHDDEYDPTLLSMLELIWGEGFLSPGGLAAVDEIVEGLDLTDKLIIDIGSGLGGVDVHLAQKNGARVIGLEIERPVVELARERVERAGLSDRIDLRHCEPGPLPLEDSSADVVFSKDSLIHVEDKGAAFQDYSRVLKPGGWLAMSDWMRSREPYGKDMEYWFEMEGLRYHMQPLDFYAEALEGAGFAGVTVADTSAGYRELCDREYALMRGDLNARMEELLGPATRDHFIENWRAMTIVLHKGELRTGRIRARKPV
ncbi:MAG: methyltransferase domain-containing protein [Kiloniellales bacterium]